MLHRRFLISGLRFFPLRSPNDLLISFSFADSLRSPFHGFRQFFQINRLQNIIHSTELYGILQIINVPIATDEQHIDIGIFLHSTSGQLNAIHPHHFYIGNQNIDFLIFQKLPCICSVRKTSLDFYGVLLPVEMFYQSFPDNCLIIHYDCTIAQHFRLFLHKAHLRSDSGFILHYTPHTRSANLPSQSRRLLPSSPA